MKAICKSGLVGWRKRLQTNYKDFEEFEAYDDLREIHLRLDFPSSKAAWEANPLCEGSTNPDDFRRVC